MFIALLFMLYGYSRGFTKEFLSIFSLFFSVYFSIHFYPYVSEYLRKYIEMFVLADSISFSILFVLTFSIVNIIISLIVNKIRNTSFSILDKNLGILIGFIKSIVILSLLFIALTLSLWKDKIPKVILEAKTIKVISYTSHLIVDIIPKVSLDKILTIFEIKDLNPLIFKKNNKNGIEKYTEPAMNPNLKKDKEGYTKNDNESLDKLFNIENEE